MGTRRNLYDRRGLYCMHQNAIEHCRYRAFAISPAARRPKSPPVRPSEGVALYCRRMTPNQRHDFRCGSLPSLKSLFHGNAATPRRFIYKLTIGELTGDLDSLAAVHTMKWLRHRFTLTQSRNRSCRADFLHLARGRCDDIGRRADKVAEAEKVGAERHGAKATFTPTSETMGSPDYRPSPMRSSARSI